MAVELYGIKNCDSVKKAIAWLKENNIDFNFHDFKKEGISEEKLKEWMLLDTEKKLVNKNGTTWRALSAEEKEKAGRKSGALLIMKLNNSLIKRPVAEFGNSILIGFDPERYQRQFC